MVSNKDDAHAFPHDEGQLFSDQAYTNGLTFEPSPSILKQIPCVSIKPKWQYEEPLDENW